MPGSLFLNLKKIGQEINTLPNTEIYNRPKIRLKCFNNDVIKIYKNFIIRKTRFIYPICP